MLDSFIASGTANYKQGILKFKDIIMSLTKESVDEDRDVIIYELSKKANLNVQ